MAHQPLMRSRLSLPSPIFYPALVLEGGLSGASMLIHGSFLRATRTVDKAHGTWRADGLTACALVSPLSASDPCLTSLHTHSSAGGWIHQITSLRLVVYESFCALYRSSVALRTRMFAHAR